jgi:hypothetical protein
MKTPITREEVTEGLRALVDEFMSGYRPVPTPGQGMQRINGLPLVPIVVHDALCGWRVSSTQDDSSPEALGCAGCGLAYLRSEAMEHR